MAQSNPVSHVSFSPRTIRWAIGIAGTSLASLLLLCLFWNMYYPSKARQDAGRSPDSRRMTTVEIWKKVASEVRLSSALSKQVADLLEDCGPSVHSPLKLADATRLEASLQVFLRQYHSRLIDRAIQRGTCYWTAWLLADAAQRRPLTDTEKEAIREQYARFVDDAIDVFDKGSPTAGADPGVDRNVAAGKEAMMRYIRSALWLYFDALSNDPMFPGLKTTLDRAECDRALRHVLSAVSSMSHVVSTSAASEGEAFLRNRAVAKQLPGVVVYKLVAMPVLRKVMYSSYWGHMMYDSESTVRSGPWPMLVMCWPTTSTNESRNNHAE